MSQTVAEVQDYVLTVLPKINQDIQAKCDHAAEPIDLVTALGFVEVAFNTLLVGSGLLGGTLSIRWPKSIEQLRKAKAMTGHDWFLLPAKPQIEKSPASVYVAGLKTANKLFDYVVANFSDKTGDSLLKQAMQKGLTSAADKKLKVDADSYTQYYLIDFQK